MMSPPKILFIHGLESGPVGAKTQALRAQGFPICAENMFMSRWRPDRKNSALRNILRHSEFRTSLLAAAGLAVGSRWLGSRPGMAAALSLPPLWWYARREVIAGQALARSFKNCVEIQALAVRRHRPDIVLGSSWGGAVAAELVLQGVWRGPTVLLAPALEQVDRRIPHHETAWRRERLRALSSQVPIVIFHDPSDEVIPAADSIELARDSSIQLYLLEAGGHRLLDLLDTGRLGEELRRLALTRRLTSPTREHPRG